MADPELLRSLVILERDELYLKWLIHLVSALNSVKLVGSASASVAGVALVRDLQPNLVLCDVNLLDKMLYESFRDGARNSSFRPRVLIMGTDPEIGPFVAKMALPFILKPQITVSILRDWCGAEPLNGF
ncbi:MAG: hypothetical protein C7B46_01900 [Sulfobacillus benefaciens]|uniref:Stage 0 sporulation protein A homolog n=1 Tax=Sulfobacillus benefaciens TaxID=453960 RepID=A0A2T2XL24_9FIRM|nr:MAG: hypothetical protein C7B46_01900 [Sulfobacillus benefaciens]